MKREPDDIQVTEAFKRLTEYDRWPAVRNTLELLEDAYARAFRDTPDDKNLLYLSKGIAVFLSEVDGRCEQWEEANQQKQQQQTEEVDRRSRPM